jgi:GNAT superfamily N-acetyltransferase
LIPFVAAANNGGIARCAGSAPVVSHAAARMSNDLTIRFVARQDYEQWLPLWNGYNAFYGRAGATALAPEITAMTWQRFFDAYEPVHALVAESDGALLGLTHYLFHRSTTAIEPVCYLQDLFTSEAARGKGVGRALINGVYDEARRAGSSRVYWQTHETNRTAMQLYDKVAEKSGFVVYRKLF